MKINHSFSEFREKQKSLPQTRQTLDLTTSFPKHSLLCLLPSYSE